MGSPVERCFEKQPKGSTERLHNKHSKLEKKHLSHLQNSPRVSFFPQIAIAIGVLTSNRGEGDEPVLRIGRGTRMPLQGAVDVVPLQGAIVLWLSERGAIAGCRCSVPLYSVLRLSGCGAIAGCHCTVPL